MTQQTTPKYFRYISKLHIYLHVNNMATQIKHRNQIEKPLSHFWFPCFPLRVSIIQKNFRASLLITPLLEPDARTAPRCKARWIFSSWATGHQHSPIRHFWVMSILNQFMAWYIVLIFLTLIDHILIDSAMEERRAKRWTSVCVITWKYKTPHLHTSNVNVVVNSRSATFSS